ncbi:MAG TPA: hypothetical protein VFQ23_08495 [Anaerolineales bacterium]|nr:hypothetical protein [Anaerolineales bacterium]
MNQKHNFGVGSTKEFSLRVSIASLVRVIFQHPSDGEVMLALERKATLREADREHTVEVKSQPFGGAVRIQDLSLLHDLIGDFHFDSESSLLEQDFRIFIRPSAWPMLRDFCLLQFNSDDETFLETNPERELAEEFADALQINLNPEQYDCAPVATLIENEATPTNNFYSKRSPTVRLYRIFEAVITDPLLIDRMLKNSEGISDGEMRELAWADFHNGGHGWANAFLVLPLKNITDCYLDLSPKERNEPFFCGNNLLDDSVAAILESVPVPKYQRQA